MKLFACMVCLCVCDLPRSSVFDPADVQMIVPMSWDDGVVVIYILFDLICRQSHEVGAHFCCIYNLLFFFFFFFIHLSAVWYLPNALFGALRSAPNRWRYSAASVAAVCTKQLWSKAPSALGSERLKTHQGVHWMAKLIHLVVLVGSKCFSSLACLVTSLQSPRCMRPYPLKSHHFGSSLD